MSILPTTWTGKDGAPAVGLSLVAKQVMTAYAIKQKRTAAATQSKNKPRYSLPAVSPIGGNQLHVEYERDEDLEGDMDGAPFLKLTKG